MLDTIWIIQSKKPKKRVSGLNNIDWVNSKRFGCFIQILMLCKDGTFNVSKKKKKKMKEKKLKHYSYFLLETNKTSRF